MLSSTSPTNGPPIVGHAWVYVWGSSPLSGLVLRCFDNTSSLACRWVPMGCLEDREPSTMLPDKHQSMQSVGVVSWLEHRMGCRRVEVYLLGLVYGLNDPFIQRALCYGCMWYWCHEILTCEWYMKPLQSLKMCRNWAWASHFQHRALQSFEIKLHKPNQHVKRKHKNTSLSNAISTYTPFIEEMHIQTGILEFKVRAWHCNEERRTTVIVCISGKISQMY